MLQELIAVILPSGRIELEWADTQNKIDKNAQLLQKEIFKRFHDDFSAGLLFLGFYDQDVSLSPSLKFLRNFTRLFTQQLIHTPNLESMRDAIMIPLDEEKLISFLYKAPFMTGLEYLNEENLAHLWTVLNQQLQHEIQTFDGTMEQFIKDYSPNIHLIGRVYFHLVENKNNNARPFAFLATYATQLNNKGDFKHLPLKHAIEEYAKNEKKLLDLLSTVHLTAKNSPLIKEILDSGEIFHPLAWTSEEALQFLKEADLYESCGILCRIPNWWKTNKNSLKVNISIGEKNPAYLGMDAILQFNTQLMLGDTIIDETDIRRILAESNGLAFLKGKWIEVDRQKLSQALEAFEQAKNTQSKGLTLKEAMRMQMGLQDVFGDLPHQDLLEISHSGWLTNTIQKLQNPTIIKSIHPKKTFTATLRHYQQDGLNWLYFLHSLQFGACLADDMGLGKTVQVIAFLMLLKKKANENCNLLILPASLLANWEHEINRFAPSLKYFIAHPVMNPASKEILKHKNFHTDYDLVITTYTLIQKHDALNQTPWYYVILDEAQAIKNPDTKQTKAVKKLKSYNRIILTGTPIENRLSDLWSLYDFINPGLLGNAKEFSNYTKGLQKQPEQYGRLKNVITPYLLRRLKTDKSIISDLPDKIEMKAYPQLSKKQIVLYQQLVDNIEKVLETAEGIQRKGIILSSLMKFKQICNHPGQYLDNQDYTEKDSGKFGLLREICETIFEKREKVLIFTQFKEMTVPMHHFLKTIFHREGLILHGSISTPKRKKLIERFQSQDYVPFFVLSIKAGGVGLNLTEANHVIHFDRWWNPAVENQATDRAFRIGQQKNVVVHKFITKGTIEEKIDAMLEQKSTLSKNIIQSSKENWITEMDNQQLLDLFKLTL